MTELDSRRSSGVVGPSRQPGTRFFLVALLVFMVTVTLFLFIRSDYFNLTQIVIQGNQRLTEDEINQMTGLRTGVNIWQVDLRQLRQNLTQNRRVKAVKAQRQFPSTLVLDIEEYPALAIVPYAEQYLEIDENGTVLALTNSIAGKGLPIITGISCAEPVIGQAVDAGQILPVLRSVRTSLGQWVGSLSEVNIGLTGELTLYTIEGVKILVGQADAELTRKLELLNPILTDIRDSGMSVSYIDLRLPDRPVIHEK